MELKQIFQSLQNGKTSLEEVPIPSIMEDEILIKTNVSLISAGTEKMLIDFGNSNFIKKILNNKDKVNKFFIDFNIKNFEPYFDPPTTLAKKFSLRGIPTSILISKQGQEFARIIGSIDFEDKNFVNWIKKYN